MKKSMKKKVYCYLLAIVVVCGLLTSISYHDVNATEGEERDVTADEAEKILIDGNKRFVDEDFDIRDVSKELRMKLEEGGQNPIAIVVSCSDSRVPPEVIFNQGLGKLFVVRNAGNVVGKSDVGSVEYAVKYLKVPLIVVLCHEHCGAVKAAIEGKGDTPYIQAIIDKIAPAIKESEKYEGKEEYSSIVENKNANNTVKALMKSKIISKANEQGSLKIIVLKYELETGGVMYLK